MESNQTTFLARIRAALGKENQQRGAGKAGEAGSSFPDDTVILQTLVDRSREQQRILLRQLIANADALNLSVHSCASLAGAAACIVALARDSEPEFGTSREIIMHDHPLLRALDLEPQLIAQGCTLHLSRHADPEVRCHTLNAYIGITAPAWGIAESATIVQLTRPGQPRSTSLVPSIHIAVLDLSHLVASLAEAYALIRREQDLDSLVFISGPSKTADIEAHMVHGAHGPRAMHLIVLTNAPDTGEPS
jgi:L-lactate dehydrogenase complex protein LldG